MTKPTKKKRSQSEVAERRAQRSAVMLRSAACAYAAVAHLAPTDRHWLRCWRALQLAAYRVAEAL